MFLVLIIFGVDINATFNDVISKVPEVTLLFWALKIVATTLGETGGDSLSISMELGYIMV